MKSKVALLVGGSFSALPFFRILKEEGYKVIIAGKDLREPCHSLADGSLVIDYSDKTALLEACESLPLDCIVPSCNDYSYLSCAYVAEKRGLRGFDSEEVALTIHTKKAFKQFCLRHKLKSPEVIPWTDLSTAERRKLSGQPLIVKPDDAFSGIGVSVADNETSLKAAVDHAIKASRNGKYVVERFFEGTLHSHSCFLQEQKIVDAFVVDEFCTLNDFQVNCSSFPSRIGNDALTGVHAEIERIARSLKLANGLLHTQFLWGGADFQIVECMRRCPGDLYGKHIELSINYPYHFNVIAPFIGKNFRAGESFRPPVFVGRHTVGSDTPTSMSSIKLNAPARQIEFFPLKYSGEQLTGARTDKAGIFFFVYDQSPSSNDFRGDYRQKVSLEPVINTENTDREKVSK